MKVWIVCVLLCATFTLRTVTAAAIETGPKKELVLQGETTELAVGKLIIEVEDKEEAPKVNTAEVRNSLVNSSGETTELAVEELINEVEDKEEALKVNTAEGKSGICPHGFVKYGSRCFRLIRTSLSWIGAEEQCAAEQARLASVQSLGDHKFLQSLLDMAGLSKAWIGAYNFQGTWLWADTARFYYSNWYSLSNVGSYPCALMNSNVGWSNTFCEIGNPYICSIDLNKC